ncbi:hypothetical protein Tco_0737298 [Tanacetum coccineum]
MTTLAEFMIIASADNRPPMLEKSLYDSWKSRMELYIENKENGRMILNSVQNGLLVWPTVIKEDGTTRTKKYEELSVAEKLQAVCDLKATNIVLQGLPPDVYAIVISLLSHLLQPSLLDSSSLIKPSMIALFLKACYPSRLRTIHNLDNGASFQLCSRFLFIPNNAITKAGTKLLLHRAHFSCSWDTSGISTLKASAADT